MDEDDTVILTPEDKDKILEDGPENEEQDDDNEDS
jgi:hypothetical protein